MKLIAWGDTLAAASSVILIGLYSASLVKLYRGSRLRVVALMTGLLLACNFFFVINSASAYYFQKAGDVQTAAMFGSLENAFYALGDVAFGEAHWILAMHYYKTAVNVPRVLQGMAVTADSGQVRTYWTGIVVSAVLPLFMGVMNVL